MVRRIALRGRRGQGLEAIVDDADYPLVGGFPWALRGGKSGGKHVAFVVRSKAVNGKRRSRDILMHRLIMRARPGQLIDHMDGDILNNRRSNLRFATSAENARNRKRHRHSSSRFKGVTWHKQCQKWQAAVGYQGRRIYLGIFKDEEDAARAYDAAARRLFGEFALLNFKEKAAA